MRTKASLLSCLIWAFWFQSIASAQNSGFKGGDPLNPALDIRLSGGQTLRLEMRYCPKGKLSPGDPETSSPQLDKDARVEVGPFFISETEVSQKQFFLVLEEHFKGRPDLAISQSKALGARAEVLENVGNASLYLQRLREVYQKEIAEFGKPAFVWEPKNKDERDYPIYYLGVHEAALYCVALNNLVSSQYLGGPLTYHFRLPTNHEWQYACRGLLQDDPDPEKARMKWPHFNPWPDPKVVPQDTLKKMRLLTEALAEKPEVGNRLGPFEFTQEFLWRLLDEAKPYGGAGEKEEKALECLQEVLAAGCGYKGNVFQTEQGHLLVHAGAGNSNAWFIKNLHGNVAEWTVKERKDWDLLELASHGNKEAIAELKTKKVIAAGGSYDFVGKGGVWKRLTLWGGVGVPFDEACDAGKVLTYAAGIRIIAEAMPSPRFLADLRSLREGVKDETTYKKAKEKVQLIEQELSNLEDVKLAKQMRALLAYYDGLLLFGNGRYDESATKIQEARTGMSRAEQADGYLEILQYRVKNGSRKE